MASSGPVPTGTSTRYRGRFAPSPTGPLHFGSLVCAAASYLRALRAGGDWLLRIEDIDPPREIPGASQQIIDSLQAHGFEWTGDVVYQSQRLPAYQAAVENLLRTGQAYACTCSRSQVQEAGSHGPVGLIYPGTCRALDRPAADAAIRIRIGDIPIRFTDALHGQIDRDPGRQLGDFIIRRRDGLPAYALAVVMDDHAAGITEVVRGTDLLEMTPGQIWLQQRLGLPTPDYLHIPVATDRLGNKLSKQTHAVALDESMAAANLRSAFEFLGLPGRPRRPRPTLTSLWAWATEQWQPETLAGIQSCAAPERYQKQ